MSGIGRELRYMEYKLRKKHSEWDKERKKAKQNQNDKKVPSMKEFQSEQVPEEFTDSLPSDKNEEQLQIQVALAISQEEEKEAKRKEESDRMRLEIALKQSETAMAEAEAKAKLQQQSQAQSSSDPWGASSSTPSPAVDNAFDPFSAGPSTSSSNAVDPWGGAALAKPPSAQAPIAGDPWSQSSTSAVQKKDSFSDLFTANSTPVAPAVDPWGTSTSSVTPPVASNNFDPFQSSSAATVATTTPAFDGFASATTSQGFDPLAEFDNLQLSSAPAPAPQPAVAPFVLEPLVATNAQPLTVEKISPVMTPQTNKADNFLAGSMSGLIDMNSLLPSKPVTNPYAMAAPSSTTTTSRNPFLQKAPAPSLNQLQVGSQAVFVEQQQDFSTSNVLMPQQQQPFFGGQQVSTAPAPSFSSLQNPF